MVVPLGLGNKMNTGNLSSGWRRGREREDLGVSLPNGGFDFAKIFLE